MAALPLNAKFVRAHVVPNAQNAPAGSMGWILRLVYEFWGFCLHGSDDLRVPGSMASSQATGSYISMPVGFESGSNVLLASGSDGTTTAGMPYFSAGSSAPFSASFVGKWLTTWKSGSTSTDDSVYPIVGWLNSSSIVIDPQCGGTPPNSTSAPQMTTRGSVNYRVVDYYAASGLTYASGQYFVVQFNDAGQVNVGQASSQVKVASYNSTFSELRLQLSPSGSWDGTHFLHENYAEIPPDVTLGGGYGGWGTPDWFHGAGPFPGTINLIGGAGFLMCQVGGTWVGGGGFAGREGSFFHVEVPTRLYPVANDPNPICAANMGAMLATVQATNGFGASSRWFPSPYDATLRRWPCLVRSCTGSGWNSTLYGGSVPNSGPTIGLGRVQRWNLFENPRTNKFVMTDGVLSMASSVAGQASAVGQFSLARARMRSIRFTSGNYPLFIRAGDNTDRWIHAGNGIMWPWDHALVSDRPLFMSF